ncbi:hypothetical protein VKT23_012415 [Stygiomarasmius scandens]|uniref:Aminotransferase class I/classII large domain-containing protein n=1 Tax=Marasmiellus scandens TaxID=2682957 RepID=A0ABR1J743_9AGAR
MSSNNEPRKAIDLSHHVNKMSRSRGASPLKHIFQYLAEPGMISLAGGLPHPSLFPYQQLDLKVYTPDAKITPGEAVNSSMALSLPQYANGNQLNTLSKALQYYSGRGSPTLTALFYDFTARIMRPGYANWQVLLNSGSTDGWSKVVNLFCEPGDYIIVEEHTFPSAQALWAPMGCKGVAVKMDKDGMIPEDLERIMENWATSHPGIKRPHLLYTVPVGQNPTGSTLTWERKKAIYEICVTYDIIICEDDPYYFLQLPQYVAPSERSGEAPQGVAIIEELLVTWGQDGYLRWLLGIRENYGIRRDWIVDIVRDVFDVLPAGDDYDNDFIAVIKGHGKDTNPVPLFSFSYPKGGMFLYIKVHLGQNPDFKALKDAGEEEPDEKWTREFWQELIQEKILVTPHWFYAPVVGPGEEKKKEPDVAFFRLAFSYESREDMYIGVQRLAKAFGKSWQNLTDYNVV